MSDEKTKGQVYDAEISPLMAQIIAISKRRGIAMFASFALDMVDDPDCESDPEHVLYCTTHLPDEAGKPHKRFQQFTDVIYRETSNTSAMRITTRDKDGNVVSEEVVIA